MLIITKSFDSILDLIERIGRAGIFIAIGIWSSVSPPYRPLQVLKQLHFIGTKSLLVIIVAGIFVGMVVALLFYETLVRFGSVAMLGVTVGMSLLLELGPVLTALILIGRAGSAICAEISIMRSENQLDALECMAVDPYQYIIAPRIIAALISVPLLTALFITVGILGGYFIGVIQFGVSAGSYLGGMADAVTWHDIVMCASKAFFFGLVMIWVATVKGYYMHLDPSGAHGSAGVSKVTTDAVVLSSIAILFTDYILTAIIL